MTHRGLSHGPPATSSSRVLVVDDDRFLGETLVDILAEEQIHATLARTGTDALAELRLTPHAIALVDVSLPDVGGIDLMPRLREVAPDLDIVIVTGNATLQTAVAALNQGASRYIVKPCAPDELLALVRDLLERRQLRDNARLYMRRLEIQNDLSEALSSALTPEDVAWAAVEAVRKLADVQVAIVASPLEAPGPEPAGEPPAPRALAWAGFRADEVHELSMRPELREHLAQGFGESAGTIVIPGAAVAEGEPTTAIALYRLRGRTRDLGVLAVTVDRDRALDEDHWVLLAAVSNWVGVSLERSMLYRRLEMAYADVKTAQRGLVQTEKHSAIGRLAAGLAHEVGTPLNIISGRAEFLLELVGKHDPRVGQGLRTIVQQIERITRLVGQLLDFAREYTPARDRIELTGVIAAVAELLDRTFAKARVDLVLDLPPDLPGVVANFNQMQQVFINLIMNSIDAVVADPEHQKGKGRGRVQVSAMLVPKTRMVRVRIEDNGHGIRDEHVDKVFDPFFSTKPVGTGTGLGLAVVYGIVTEHGGTIEVDSRWGVGTTVTFTLPTEMM